MCPLAVPVSGTDVLPRLRRSGETFRALCVLFAVQRGSRAALGLLGLKRNREKGG